MGGDCRTEPEQTIRDLESSCDYVAGMAANQTRKSEPARGLPAQARLSSQSAAGHGGRNLDHALAHSPL